MALKRSDENLFWFTPFAVTVYVASAVAALFAQLVAVAVMVTDPGVSVVSVAVHVVPATVTGPIAAIAVFEELSVSVFPLDKVPLTMTLVPVTNELPFAGDVIVGAVIAGEQSENA